MLRSKICFKFSKFFRVRPNASERFRMHPAASERVRMHPNRSEQVQKHRKTCEMEEKLQTNCEKLRKVFAEQAFAKIFAKISRNFRGFRKFFEVFGLARTCWDLFGCVGIRSDASGCVRTPLDTFLQNLSIFFFRTFSDIFFLIYSNFRSFSEVKYCE